MEEANRVCSLLCLSLLLTLTTFSESCSDVTAERLISGNRYRVQDQFFIADSVDDKYTPQQARLEGDSWCSADSLTASSEPPWLQITFGKEFNISIIQTGGYDGYLKNYYVTRFEVHIGNGTKGSLHPLTMSDNHFQPLVFRRTRTYDVEDTVLPSPVIARVLRIVAVEWSPRNQVCLRLEALGCLPSPAPPTVPMTTTEVSTESSSYTTQDTQPTEEITEAISYTTQKTPPTEAEASSYTTQELISVSPHGRSKSVIVVGAVAGGLGLMVTLLLLFVVVAAIYIFTRRRRVFFMNKLFKLFISHYNKLQLVQESAPLSKEIHPRGPTFSRAKTSFLKSEDILSDCRAQVQLPESCEVYSEVPFDNSTSKEIPLQSLCRDTPEHKFDNCIYGDKKLIKTENHLDIRDVPSSIMSNIYESIPASTSIFHEPIQDFNGTLDPQDEGMHDNPLYDKRSEEDFKMEYHLARPSVPSSVTLNTYESIPATTTILNEPITDLLKTIDPHDEEMQDNPHYDKSSEEDFKMEYHLSQQSISSLNTYELLHEPVQDLNGTLDPQDQGMQDNSLYDKSSEEDIKMEYHLSQQSNSSLNTYELLHEPVQDLNGTLDPQDQGIQDNSLYDKSNEKDFNMEYRLSQPSISLLNTYESAILHEPVENLNGTLDPQDQGMHDNPLYDKSSEDDFKMEYHLARPSVPSSIASNICESTPTTTAIQDVNGTVDPHDQQMSDNPLYGKINA